MKSLSLISTQMQLINCIEYLVTHKIEENEVVFWALSKTRKTQLLDVFNIPCNRQLFKGYRFFTFNGGNIHDILVSVWMLFKMWIWALTKKVDVFILGNYKTCYGRFFWYKQPNAKRTVVDDGLGTPIWYEIRANRGFKGISEMFYDNKIIRSLLKRKEDAMVPESVRFFSIYTDIKNPNDSVEFNSYSYLKANIGQYPESDAFKSCDFVFLGQPFHTRGYVSHQKYNEYLKKTYSYIGEKQAIYYPHPEETDNSWMDDVVKTKYQFIPNKMIFEVFALAMKPKSVIASFQTSSQPILLKLCPDIKQLAVYLEEADGQHTPFFEEIKEAYKYLENLGIPVIHLS